MATVITNYLVPHIGTLDTCEFLNYVVDDNENTYPEDDYADDGYLYEKVASKTLELTTSGEYTSDEAGIGVVKYTPRLQDLTITSDGVYNAPSSYAGLGTVTVSTGTVKQIAHGTSTPSAQSYFSFEHNLGKIPDFVIIWSTFTNSSYTTVAEYNSSQSSSYFYVRRYYQCGSKSISSTYESTETAYLDTTKCSVPSYSTSYRFSGTYYWVAGIF